MSTDNTDNPRNPSADRAPGSSGVSGEIVADPNVSDPAAATDPRPTQDEPSMDASPTTAQAKIDGIVAQTRADFPEGADAARFEHALRQRFRETGVDVDDEQIRALMAG